MASSIDMERLACSWRLAEAAVFCGVAQAPGSASSSSSRWVTAGEAEPP